MVKLLGVSGTFLPLAKSSRVKSFGLSLMMPSRLMGSRGAPPASGTVSCGSSRKLRMTALTSLF